MVHCLFEQSGTFKNEFKKLGMDAQDYDILNDFNQTDNIIDLFCEIENSYNNLPSIFDNITEDDLVIAFFPCIRFISSVHMWFQGNCYSQKKWTDLDKVEYNIKLHKELSNLYDLFCKMVAVCIKRNIKLIVENPYQYDHYLVQYFPVKASIIDTDRTNRGDNFKKPTQFWFFNCEPKHNFIFGEKLKLPESKIHTRKNNYVSNQKERSMINPIYANRFIREFIL